jgi:hypothetical protein
LEPVVFEKLVRRRAKERILEAFLDDVDPLVEPFGPTLPELIAIELTVIMVDLSILRF